MTDIAELGFRVNSASAVKATTDLDRLGDQAEVTERQVVGAATKSTKAFNSMSAPMRRVSAAGRSIDGRGIAMQLSQVAQSASATGRPLQALAIQLPDIAMYLGGPVAIAAGVAAGALLPLIGNFVSAGDKGREFDDVLDAIALSIADLEGPMDVLTMSVVDLKKTYGAAAQQVREFALFQAEARVAQAREDLRRQVPILQDVARAYYSTTNAGRSFRNSLQRITRDFGITGQAARDFEALIQDAATAPSFEQQQAALLRIVRYLDEAGVSAADIPPEVAKALGQMIDLSNETDRAAKLAKDVADAASEIAPMIGAGADEAARLANNLTAAAAAQMKSGLAAQYQMYGEGRAIGERLARESQALYGGTSVLPTLRKRSSGGGRSRVTEAERLKEMWLGRIQTATEKYNAELKELNELQKAGYLTAEQYAQAVAMVTDEFERAEFAPIIAEIESISDALADAIVNGEDLGDAMGRIFRQIASDLISSGIKSLLMDTFRLGGSRGGGGGGFLGSLFGGLFGGFRADGGPVTAGKTYMTGERGPELFTPSTSGFITPNHALGGTAKVEVVLDVPEGVTVGEVQQIAGDVAVQVTARSNRRVGERHRRS